MFDLQRARKIARYHGATGMGFVVFALIGPIAVLFGVGPEFLKSFYHLYLSPLFFGGIGVMNLLIAWGLYRGKAWAWNSTGFKDPRWWASKRAKLSAIAIASITFIAIVLILF